MATVTLNGATAQDWIDNASDQRITLTISADPAGESEFEYDGTNSVYFDATQRDHAYPF